MKNQTPQQKQQPLGPAAARAPHNASLHPTPDLAWAAALPDRTPVSLTKSGEDSSESRRKRGGDDTQRALRAIAVFEAAKGLLAAAAMLGLLSLLHNDLHRLAAALISHIGLLPGDHYPALFLHNLDQLLAADRRPLLLAATAYVGVRLAEAYGLWHQRPWACWLGALSGALYLPFEMLHLMHQPSALGAAVVAVNLALVAYLAWRAAHRTGP